MTRLYTKSPIVTNRLMAHILDSIEILESDVMGTVDSPDATPSERVAYSKARYLLEGGSSASLGEWLAGLPFDIEYDNYKLVILMCKWNNFSLDEGMPINDTQIETITTKWWGVVAEALTILWAMPPESVDAMFSE